MDSPGDRRIVAGGKALCPQRHIATLLLMVSLLSACGWSDIKIEIVPELAATASAQPERLQETAENSSGIALRPVSTVSPTDVPGGAMVGTPARTAGGTPTRMPAPSATPTATTRAGPGFLLIDSLEGERHSHSASLLADGRVLVAGGATGGWQGPSMVTTELYDPTSGSWQPGPSLTYPRQRHTATTLADGRVFVTGGIRPGPIVQDTTEILEPARMRWQVRAPLSFPRYLHSATLLSSGQLLVLGGYTGSTTVDHAEIYDPGADTWRPVGSLHEARHDHSATLLPDGRILVVGGYRGTWLPTAEIFDPAGGTSTPTNPIFCHGTAHEAVLLADGRVLVAGGACGSGPPGIVAQAEIFDPATNSWQAVAPMAQARYRLSAARLADGRVLVAGGSTGAASLAGAESFDPATGSWQPESSLNVARAAHTATLLPDGSLLVTAGLASMTETLDSAELLWPGR